MTYPVIVLANDGKQSSELVAYTQLAQQAEAKGADAIIFNDDATQYVWEPQVLLAHIVAQTSTIGVGVPIGLAYSEPYHVARILATIDHFSNGRIAFEPKVLTNFDAQAHYQKQLSDVQYEDIAAESLAVILKLHDSWDDDAVLNDKVSGRFLNTKKIRHINHVGEHFKVRGPSPAPRPVQGYVPAYAVVQGELTAIAKQAELLFATGTLEQVEAVYAQKAPQQQIFVAADVVEDVSFDVNGVFISPAQLATVEKVQVVGTLRERLQLSRPAQLVLV